jgi:hypothetical protein
MEVYMVDLQREICKPVPKLDFSAHSIMKSLSEFRLGVYTEEKNMGVW